MSVSQVEITAEAPQRLSVVHWLIMGVASLGFAFDSYELLMAPLVVPPALAELLHVDPTTASGFALVRNWYSVITWASAICGGVFGLLGGYLTDRFGRRRVLVWSILLYAFSALAAGFSTSVWMFLVLRCMTFIGICVEFVAAVAWLAELFPHPKQRERILGWTQAFSSVGGIMATGAFLLFARYAAQLPPIGPGNNAWRYTLISGLIPAIPLIVIRPFLPESPEWQIKKALGKLKRPSLGELFVPAFRRTTLVTTAMNACSFATAFGAIMMTPQIVPGLVPDLSHQVAALRQRIGEAAPDTPEAAALRKEYAPLQRELNETISNTQLFQEIGGLIGRMILAALAVWIVSRRRLLRVFLTPGLIVIPLVFLFPGAGRLSTDNAVNLQWLRWGIFITGVLTVAQFSFWGNYLPRVYPVHLRGTGESFAANVGGRMIGTSAVLLTSGLAAIMPGTSAAQNLAFGAAATAFLVYALNSILCFWLPEPVAGELPD
jgi:MFS family permease